MRRVRRVLSHITVFMRASHWNYIIFLIGLEITHIKRTHTHTHMRNSNPMSTITEAAGVMLAVPEQAADWPDEDVFNQTNVWQPPIDMVFNDGHRLSIAVYRYECKICEAITRELITMHADNNYLHSYYVITRTIHNMQSTIFDWRRCYYSLGHSRHILLDRSCNGI